VDGFFGEWPEWCTRFGRPVVEEIFACGSDGAMPVVLVAHRDGELLGTIALRPYFGEEPMAETPWVRQLFVFPRHRGRGKDRALISGIEHAARALGFARLYAATNRIEPLLVRRGWEVFRRIDHEGRPMAWLRKSILRSASGTPGTSRSS
jgi:N-acetylglutamate synthase-like GNAT family acetyltransferase